MVAWIALFISSVGLIVTIISERDKLIHAFYDFRRWLAYRKEKKIAEKAIAEFSTVNENDEIQLREQEDVSISTYFKVLFPPLAVSSAIISIVGPQTELLASLVALTTFIPLVTFTLVGLILKEKETPSFKWYYWPLIPLGFVAFLGFISFIWAGGTIALASDEISIFWAGIISATITLVCLWAAVNRNSSRTLK